MRIFVAILLDNDIKSHIKGMSDKLSHYFEKARFTRIENYHITVKFIGETDRRGFEKIVSAVKNIAPEVKKFVIKTSGPGSFKRRGRHIFYCSIMKSRKLQKLHDVLCSELAVQGIVSGTVRFSPHITIAREVLLSDRYTFMDFEEKTINVDRISVMESTRINGKLTYIPRFTAELGG